MFQIQVSQETCIGCGYCTTICPYTCFEMKITPGDDAGATTAPCQSACPIGNDIRAALAQVARVDSEGEDMDEALSRAWQIYAETNPMPAVLGRVCPHPCEGDCNRSFHQGAVNINQFERFIGDWGIEKQLKPRMLSEGKRSEKVAVIGSGPAGISCAYQLARRGYSVSVYEAFEEPGGMLRYGIPEYRLPRRVLDAEIQRVLSLGVEIKVNTVVGKDVLLEDLQKDFQAVFVAIGRHKGCKLGVSGEEGQNIHTGVDFLNRVNRGEKIQIEDDVVIIGGGNVAIDVARVCKRLGAAKVSLYCLEKKDEMPAIKEEVEEALTEGIAITTGVGVQKIETANGKVSGITFVGCTAIFDAQGNFNPQYDPSETFDRSASTIVVAIAQEPDSDGKKGKMGTVQDWLLGAETGNTGLQDVYAGGDIHTPGLVTDAVAEGHAAARAIDARLRKEPCEVSALFPEVTAEKSVHNADMLVFWAKPAPRRQHEIVAAAERFGHGEPLSKEVVAGLDQSAVVAEAKRCFSCNTLYSQATECAPEDCVACRSCQVRCVTFAIDVIEPAQ